MCLGQELNGHGTNISEVPGLTVVNLDPEKAAAEYRESVISPYRGKIAGKCDPEYGRTTVRFLHGRDCSVQ